MTKVTNKLKKVVSLILIFTLLFSTNVFAGENEKAASRSMTSYTETVEFYHTYENGTFGGEITITFDYVDGSWSRIISVDEVDIYIYVSTSRVKLSSSEYLVYQPNGNTSVVQIFMNTGDEHGYVYVGVDEYSEVTAWYSEGPWY